MSAFITLFFVGLIAFVLSAAGVALIVFNSLPGICHGSITAGVRKKRIVAGSALAVLGVALVLASVAFVFFGALPGPGIIETWSEARAYVQKLEPDVSITRFRITYPLHSDGPQPSNYYDLDASTRQKTFKLRLWYDPETKQTIRIEDRP